MQRSPGSWLPMNFARLGEAARCGAGVKRASATVWPLLIGRDRSESWSSRVREANSYPFGRSTLQTKKAPAPGDAAAWRLFYVAGRLEQCSPAGLESLS